MNHLTTAARTAPGPEVPAIAGACLRAYDSDGNQIGQVCVVGPPQMLDAAANEHGTRYAGIDLVTLEDGKFGTVMLDSRNVEWWDALITESIRARNALVYGGFRDRVPAAAGSQVTP